MRTALQRMDLVAIQGNLRSSGETAGVVLAGQRPWVEYLADAAFAGVPDVRKLGSVPVWALPRMLDRLASSGDAFIARLDQLWARWLFGDRFLDIPEWVEVRLDLTQDLESILTRSASVQRDLERIRRHRLTSEVSRSAPDFDEWYDQHYVPFIRSRHTKYGYVARKMRLRNHFRHGALLWVVQDGRRLAGILLGKQGLSMRSSTMGVLNGDYEVMRLGVVGGVYYYSLLHALAEGCTELHFGGTRSMLADGEVRFKRKWGFGMVQRQDTYRFILGWHRVGQGLLAFLSQVPTVLQHHGQLCALAAITGQGLASGADVQRAHRDLWMPGIARLYLLAESGWEAGCSLPRDTELLDPSSLSRGGLPRLPSSALRGAR